MGKPKKSAPTVHAAALPRKGFLSVSKALFAKLEATSRQTGAPIGVLVELAVAPEIGLDLSPIAVAWRERLFGKAKSVS